MDAFEGIVRLLMERDGFWTRQSHKVNLTKDEKREIGKPTIPRPEIDILAYNQLKNEIIALEAKSFLDSSGVQLKDLTIHHNIPTGRYKLFTCKKYRDVVFRRLMIDLKEAKVIRSTTTIRLGLAAGRVKKEQEEGIRTFCGQNNWHFLGPSEIKQKVVEMANDSYENDPYIITAKLALR